MLLLQVRSLSKFPSLSFLYNLATDGSSGTQVVHLPLCDPLWVLVLWLELGVLLGLLFPLCWVLSLMKFARVSLMSVCRQVKN
jgi:hypothetical protein